MTCYELAGGLTICTPPTGTHLRAVEFCPTCDRRRRMVRTFGGAWYGDTVTCCACGESWSEGERMERPFRPRWRQEAAAEARRRWASAGDRETWNATVRSALEAAI